MAKAKKSETASGEASEKPAAAAKSAKKATKSAAAAPAGEAKAAAPAKGAKKAAKPAAAAPSGPASQPLIDTNLAAQAAAAMVLNRGAVGGAGQQNQPAAPKESAAFKALKQGLNKPAGLGNIPGGSFQPKKGVGNQPFGGPKQVGHNQTFGADINRTGVPRRTSG